MNRSRNLTDADISKIAEELRIWVGKLTWELLIERLTKLGLPKYTRQALFKYERITTAFQHRKKQPSEAGQKEIKASTPELRAALEKNVRLKAENEQLVAENKRLLEQFRRWATNAAKKNLDFEYLNQEINSIHRSETPVNLRGSASKLRTTHKKSRQKI